VVHSKSLEIALIQMLEIVGSHYLSMSQQLYTDTRSPRRTGLIAAFAIIALFLMLIALRGVVVFQGTSGVADCALCMAATGVQQDSTLLAVMLTLVGLGFLSTSYWLQLPWALLSILLVLTFAADVSVSHSLSQRLYALDLIVFDKEISAIGIFGMVQKPRVLLNTRRAEASPNITR